MRVHVFASARQRVTCAQLALSQHDVASQPDVIPPGGECPEEDDVAAGGNHASSSSSFLRLLVLRRPLMMKCVKLLRYKPCHRVSSAKRIR